MTWWMIERETRCLPRARAHAFQSRFSREHKHVILEEEENHDRKEKPVVCPQGGARAQQFIFGDDETELDLSLGSRSFLESSAKKAKTISNECYWRQRITFCDMENVHVVNIGVICIHGKELQTVDSIKIQKSINICSTFLQIGSEQDEIYGVKTIDWENSSWTFLSLIGDEQVISLQRTMVYVFSDSVLCLGKKHENPQSNDAWEDRLTWFKSSPEKRALDRIDGEPMEFEWNIFPGFNTLQLSQEVQELLLRLSETPENFTGRIIFMSMFNDISWGSKDNKKECESKC